MDLARTTPVQTGSGDRPGNGGWKELAPSFIRDTAARRLKALGHPDRLRIIEVLSQRPAFVGEIAARVGLPLATVSRHLRTLHAAGVLDCSQHGNRVLYALTDRELPRLAAVAYRSAAVCAGRVVASAPELPEPAKGIERPRDG